ncbi:MAG: hypothetical protein ACYS47_20005 [Planctomycetota bacterium]
MPEISRFFGIIIRIFFDDHKARTHGRTRLRLVHPRMGYGGQAA